MSKRSRKRHQSRKRDFKTIANPPSPRLLSRPRISSLPNISLLPIEDFRLDSFPLTRARAYNLVTAQHIEPVKYVKSSAIASNWHMPSVRQQLPLDAVVCVRRARRREVLFAKGRAGSGRTRRRYRINETSKIVCR